MAFKTLERKKVQTLTMGKENLMEFVGILIDARVNVGRNKSVLYTFKTQKDGIKKIWGNQSIDEALLNETGKTVMPEVNGALVRIEVESMEPVGDNGAERANCIVQVDSSVRAFKIEKKGQKASQLIQK